MSMDRRKFLAASLAASCASLASAARSAGSGRAGGLRLTLRPGERGNPIAADFTGLSYETSQLSDPAFFSPANGTLAGFHRRLGTAGVLRLGGNTSEYGVWLPGAASMPGRVSGQVPSQSTPATLGPDTGHRPPPRRPVTPLAVRNLRGFLELSGWRLIYGLNMGSESPETVADEAACVAGVMGEKLVAFQLCNEPDLFHRNGLRSPDYDYRQFAAEWRRYFRAVRRRVPRATFAGPDTAGSEWLVRFAHEQRQDLTFLSQHYYAEGPPTDPSMNIERLLGPSPRLDAEFKAAAAARANTGLPFRMTETNSCYHGGKQGVSDTFASALWGADLMYRLARAGATGVNFHGGGYGWYTPIAGTRGNGFAARPIYYGMLLFAVAGTGRLLATELEGAADGSLAAHALMTDDGELKVVILNKSLDKDAILTVDAAGAKKASVLRLVAPRADETADVTFGGSVVGNYGGWTPSVAETPAVRRGSVAIQMPRVSGALVTLTS